MSHYKSSRQHTEFLLFDVMRDETVHARTFPDFDEHTARDILAGAQEFAETHLAPSFGAGDREGLKLDPATGVVTLPADLNKALREHLASDWLRLDLPPDMTGHHVPPSLRWAATEFILGANPAVAMCTQLVPLVVGVLRDNGTAEQRRLAELIVEKGWTVTMVLTEPEAGSDVGAARARAIPQDDGTWHIEGTKRFITWAAHDATENVIHMVLARPQGVEGVGGPGTKGLSLFVVPEHTFDPETGEITGRNGAYVRALEKKMGITGTPTCDLVFGDDHPAVATLLGDVHDGIRQMFEIITYVRMMVGAKTAAAMSTGYLNARDYAEERVQGRALVGLESIGEPIEIIDHPDVRRSILTQRAYAEGSRALVLYTATQLDRVESARAHGERDKAAEDRHRMLLPIVKTWCAEKGFQILAQESLQTFGGAGYTRETPLEQYVRDTKIDSIYEGTTGIQAMDLLVRRIVRDRGATLGLLLDEVEKSAHNDLIERDFHVEAELLQDAVAALRDYVQLSLDRADSEPVLAALGATRLLLAIGDVVVAWLLLRSAEVAHELLKTEEDEKMAGELNKRIAGAVWFARQVMPRVRTDYVCAVSLSTEAMDLSRDHL
ncbi:MAG: acyl-CoA dehydrogenase [Tetrasphaera sp.]